MGRFWVACENKKHQHMDGKHHCGVCVCGGLDIRQEMTVESKTIKFVQRHQWLVITLHSIGKVGCV